MSQPSSKRKHLFGIAILTLLVILFTVLYFNVGRPMTKLVRNTDQLVSWLEGFGWKSRLVYIAMVCFQVIVALIPGEPLELAAGFVFGTVEGTLICMAGITLGSVIVFLLVRIFGVRLVRLFFPMEKIESLPLLREPRRLFLLTAVLMLLPGTPKDLLTYCAGLTKIPFGSWLLICSIGRIPSIITSTLCGHAVREGHYAVAIVVFLATALLCGAGLYLFARLKKYSKKEKTAEE